jgi:hypothetical protein
MTGWRATCPKRAEGCQWAIDSITEEDARTAGRLHYPTDHRSSTSAASKPIQPSWPYRGRPNKTHLHLLQLATNGRLLGYQSKIYHWNGGPIDLNDPAGTLGPPLELWVPCPMKGQIQKWVPGLIEAGLLRNPKPQTPGVPSKDRTRPYRVTPEGHQVMMQAEQKECHNASHR